MLEKLKKQLGITDAANVDMAAFDNVKAELAQLQEQFGAVQAELATVVAKAAEDKTQLEAALSTAIEHAATLEAALKEQADKVLADKLATRKQMIVDVLGDTKADATFEATKELDDSAFGVVLNALKLSLDKEANSEMFQETGVSAEADSNLVTESAVAKSLRAKYNKQ